MKILVTFKRVADIASGGAGGDEKWIINPFDEIAIEEALRIRERGEASEVVGVTVAPAAAEEQVRAALAMGLDRVMRVDDDRPLDPYAVSRILAAVVRREQPDVVLMGKQAVDDDANQTAQMIAGLLGWPQATFVSKVELQAPSRQIQCTRETDRGLETVVLQLPAVLTADLRLNEPRFVSLPALMKARRRPVEVLTCGELGVTVEPRTVVMDVRPAPRRSGGVRLGSVDELIARLRDHDRVL